jgi:hypothetical protein
VPPVICSFCGWSVTLTHSSTLCGRCGARVTSPVDRDALRASLRSVFLDAVTTLYLSARRLDLTEDDVVAIVRAAWTERDPADRPE